MFEIITNDKFAAVVAACAIGSVVVGSAFAVGGLAGAFTATVAVQSEK